MSDIQDSIESAADALRNPPGVGNAPGPVVAARLPAFRSSSRLFLSAPRSLAVSPELCSSFMAVSGYLPVPSPVVCSQLVGQGVRSVR